MEHERCAVHLNAAVILHHIFSLVSLGSPTRAAVPANAVDEADIPAEFFLRTNERLRSERQSASSVTPVDVQTREGRGQNHQAYLWQYSRPGGNSRAA
jgi:hypothetical protein